MAEQRIIVCGGRNYQNRPRVREVLAEYAANKPTIVHGGARGADKLAGDVAMHLGLDVEVYPANWVAYRKAAGRYRNEHMARLGADLCIAFPGGSGTEHMIGCARAQGIPVRRVDVAPPQVV